MDSQPTQAPAQAPETGNAPPAGNATPPQLTPRQQFIEMLPEDIRGEGVFANFSSVGDLAKSYVSAAKMVGLDKNALVSIPKDDSKEAWDAVYNKLGRPESADKYALDAYKEAIGDEGLKAWREKFHGLGLNQKQVDGILGSFTAETKAAMEQSQQAMTAQFEKWSQEIKSEYGAAADKKLEAAVNMLEKYGVPLDLVEQNPTIFKNPALVKAFVALADKTGEGEILLANGTRTSDVLSPAEAQQELNALQARPDYAKAIFDKNHPQHDYYVQQRQKLFDYIHPSAQGVKWG